MRAVPWARFVRVTCRFGAMDLSFCEIGPVDYLYGDLKILALGVDNISLAKRLPASVL